MIPIAVWQKRMGGKWIVAYGLRGEGPVWLIGAVLCLLAANRGSNCSLMWAMDSRIVRYAIISSCQSDATSEIVKAFLATSSSHAKSAVASILDFTFFFTLAFLGFGFDDKSLALALFLVPNFCPCLCPCFFVSL